MRLFRRRRAVRARDDAREERGEARPRRARSAGKPRTELERRRRASRAARRGVSRGGGSSPPTFKYEIEIAREISRRPEDLLRQAEGGASSSPDRARAIESQSNASDAVRLTRRWGFKNVVFVSSRRASIDAGREKRKQRHGDGESEKKKDQEDGILKIGARGCVSPHATQLQVCFWALAHPSPTSP